MTKEDYERLLEEIWRHNRLYYIDNRPEISDQAFDQLFKKLEEIEKIHPEWVVPDSPTQRVGETLQGGFGVVRHKKPMLSLQNAYSKEEIEAFLTRLRKNFSKGEFTFCCELKIDGLAITARYQNGKYVLGATRGNGKEGDEITANLKTIQNLPLRLPNDVTVEVRGEVYIPKKAFQKLNEERVLHDEPAWANPRNAAAGSLKLLDPREVAKRPLRVLFYGTVEDVAPTQTGTLEWLQQKGFPISPLLREVKDVAEIFDFLEEVRQKRKELPFEIDGVVIKVNSIETWDELGAAGKNPRWAIAYKFAAEQARSVVLDIKVQVGRTGVLTPVAELEPTKLAGSTISRASLHNQDEIERLDIRVGDEVLIEKGGDVIPKVIEVVAFQNERSEKWQIPSHCPSCGAEVAVVPDEVAVRCPNHLNCPEQQLKRLIFFAGKQGLDIEGMGEKVVMKLKQLNFVHRPSDFFRLTSEKLFQVEGFKEKSVQNLLKALEEAKKVPLPKFIHALGIKHIGLGTAETIAKKVPTLHRLQEMEREEFLALEGIGDRMADSLYSFFHDPSNRDEIEALVSSGITFNEQKVTLDSRFTGKTFVITGTLKSMSRAEIEQIVVSRGGHISDTVGKKSHYLILGENPGSKLEKAKKIGLSILDELEWSKWLEDDHYGS